MQPSTYFFQKIAAGHEEQMSPLTILVLLRYEAMQEICLKKNLLKTSNYLKACYASFSKTTECLIPDLHPEFISGHIEGQKLQWLVT